MIISDQIYRASFYIVALVISIATVIFNLIERRTRTRQAVVFHLILIGIAISALSAFLTVLIRNYSINYSVIPIPDAKKLMSACQIGYFVPHSSMAPLFYLYVLLVTGAYYRMSKRRKILALIPCIIAEILVLSNLFAPVVWSFDDKLQKVRGPGESVVYLAAVFYLSLSVVYLLVYWQAVTARRRWGIVYVYSLTVAGVLIQLFFQKMQIELAFEALALAGVMLTVEKEDDRLDSATGVYNRNALQKDMDNYFRLGRAFHVIVVRLTNTDIIQRITGSSDRDTISVNVSKFLRNIHPQNEIYRPGPTVFVLACPDYTGKRVRETAQSIENRFLLSWNCHGMDVRLNTMIFWAGSPQELSSTEDVLLMADGALSEEWQKGILEGDVLGTLKREAEVEKALARAVEDHTMEVYYQPVYRMQNKTLVAAEASIRLTDPTLGQVLPEEIISVAKRNNMIDRLGLMTLEEVFAFLDTGIPSELRLNAFNVGAYAIQLLHPDFLPRIRAIVERYRSKPEMINIEIREFSLSENYGELKNVLLALKEMGFLITLDRYATRDANLQALLSVDFDMVTLDFGIVPEEIARYERPDRDLNFSVVKNSISLIHGLGRRTLVKNVHTQEQVDALEEAEVNFLQGDFYSQPVSQSELIGLLRITEMAWREEQRARARSEAKSNFLANMSHEIRTPINAILGMNEMILREAENATILSYARDIERAGNTLLSLISDILDFSKIEAGSMEIAEGEYGLSSVINDVVNMMQVKIQQKGLKLVVEADETLPETLYGDEMRLRQIIVNLMNNAYKYTSEGSITLAVNGIYSNDTKDVIELLVEVRDTGIGIREEDMEKLFGTFQRLDLDHNKSVEGAGLGLAITSSLLTMMGGEISVESTYGKGSAFSFRLPQFVVDRTEMGDLKKRYLAHAQSRPDYRERFTAPDAKILVVDDTPVNLTVIKGLLRQTRIQIDTCGSGMECLSFTDQTEYDVIFLDYRMPEMDGVETLRKMKEPDRKKNRETPVICLTANVVSGARDNFLREGFDDYLAKPVDSRKLEELLQDYLPPEKVFEVDPDSDPYPGEGETEEDRIRDRIARIKEIHLAAGLERCGTLRDYLEILQIYYDSIEDNIAEIKDRIEKEDWVNYTIRVHSLKSTSRVIGAEQLGDEAAALEAAGDKRDIPFIMEKTPPLLEMYGKLKSELDGFFADKGAEEYTLPEADEETIQDAFLALSEFASAMDFENASFVLEEMESYRLPKNVKDNLKGLKTAVDRLDWDTVREILDRQIGGVM